MKRNTVVYKIGILIALIPGILGLCGCTRNNEPATYSAFAFDTYVRVTVYDKSMSYREKLDAASEAVQECTYYEKIFSRTAEDSLLYLYNASADKENFELSEELKNLIEIAEEYEKLTDGALCIHMPAVSDLWDFTGENHRIPDRTEIEAELSKITENGHICTNIDLGAVAKGYIADRIKVFLVERGVESAIIDLGGNILCVGSKQDDRGKSVDFNLAIRRPFAGSEEAMLAVKISDMSVVTSGCYERYFEENGRIYHHILDPDTGAPAESGLYSVTIISEDSVTGDALSTACFVLGAEKGKELIDSLDGVYAVFITEDYEVIKSEGAEKFVVEAH